jgi:ABC-type lipopolysaccharide export system ATPase subunit
MLKVKNVTFGYKPSGFVNKKINLKNNNLFENFSFTVNRGEIVKLSGSNGSGKTTLLNCINGFLKVDSGDILFENKSIISLPAYEISNIGIKRYFNNKEFYTMSIKDILRLVYNKNEVEYIVNHFNYNKKQVSGNLSGGEKTLLYLLMSLKCAKILLLDEPFNNLDKSRISLVREFILNIKKNNIGVLLVDHVNNISFDNEIKLEKIDYLDDSNVNYDYDFSNLIR